MHGFLAVAKHRGPTSAAVVGSVKRQLGLRRDVGHTGTLDPLASGVLLVGIGSATRFIRFLAPTKSYELAISFGRQTTTGDAEGEVCASCAPPADLRRRLGAALGAFVGPIAQTAPRYSALKYKGRPLYAYAREGREVPAKTRTVRIEAIRILACDDRSAATLRVACGPGVYMRSLAEDLGAALGSCAHLAGLERTSCHGVDLAQAAALGSGLARAKLVPADRLLAHLPEVGLDAVQARRIRDGLEIELDPGREGAARLYAEEGGFIGIGATAQGRLRPLRLLPQP